MELQFREKYISIDKFDSIGIPNFIVLTGVNGSGKSHLLGALEQRKVVISGMENAHIVLFNYETFKLDNEGAVNAQQISSEREQAWNFYNQSVKPNALNWRNGLGEKYNEMKNICATEKKSFLSFEREELSPYQNNFKNYYNSNKQNLQLQGIYSLAKRIPYSIDEIEHDDFIRRYKPFTFKNNFLPNQIGKIIWDYYVKYHRNEFNKYQNEKNGQNHTVLSDDDFVELHGEKPWELINRILETFDTMQYRVNSPEKLDYFESFQLKLVHIEKDNLEIQFDALSSGEKILMALVASIYKSRTDKNFPDILLLDEVDASLHPSMMKNMLDVIEKIFVKEGVKVILVSHSPTTIALAPEESVYVMNRSGQNRIEKKSKQDALSILTQGFATIEQGLKLFDQITSKVTIITEGYNTCYISKALELFNIKEVDVLSGIEDKTGKSQLKTLFDFLSRMQHSNKVIFVWDCDVNYTLDEANNTYPYILPKNHENTIATNGVENIFPEILFENFKTTITSSRGEETRKFDKDRKRDFEVFILERNNPDDFKNFDTLIKKIEFVKTLS